MKLKKRTKASRIRGGRTCGYGFRQKHKGSGNKGGKGFAGSGKRADHKKQKLLTMAKEAGAKAYFGKKGFTSRSTEKKRTMTINLIAIKRNYDLGKTVDLKKYKILGEGDGFKAVIEAESASKQAIDKMKKAGGDIIILASKVKKVASEEKGKKEVAKKKQ